MSDSIYIIKKDALEESYDALRALADRHGDAPLIEGVSPPVADPLTAEDLHAYEGRFRLFGKKESRSFRLSVLTPSGEVAYLRDASQLQRAYEELRKLDYWENGDIDADKGKSDLVLDFNPPQNPNEAGDEQGLGIAQSGAVGFDAVTLIQARQVVTDFGAAVFAIKTNMPATTGWSGTGFIFNKTAEPDGSFTYEVATNSHVADFVYEDQLALKNGTPLNYTLTSANGAHEITTAKLVGTDPLTDAAVLRFTSSLDLPECQWGDGAPPEVFDPVVSYGNSAGLDLRPAIGRVLSGELGSSQPLFPLLRVDPIITGGNSGGPVFSLDGRVIGVSVQKFGFDPPRPNFEDGLLIPAADMKASVERILASEAEGHPGSVSYGDWGMTVYAVEQAVRREFLPEQFVSGAVQITKIEPGSPAEAAGLEAGDLVIQVDGSDAAVRVTNANHLYRFRSVILNSVPGEMHELTVMRPGGWIDQYAVTARSKLYGPVPTSSVAGITVQDITDDVREAYRIPDTVRGVIVLSDNSKSETTLNLLIITEVNGGPVEGHAAFETAMTAAEQDGRAATALTLVQGPMSGPSYDPSRGGMYAEFYASVPK